MQKVSKTLTAYTNNNIRKNWFRSYSIGIAALLSFFFLFWRGLERIRGEWVRSREKHPEGMSSALSDGERRKTKDKEGMRTRESMEEKRVKNSRVGWRWVPKTLILPTLRARLLNSSCVKIGLDANRGNGRPHRCHSLRLRFLQLCNLLECNFTHFVIYTLYKLKRHCSS